MQGNRNEPPSEFIMNQHSSRMILNCYNLIICPSIYHAIKKCKKTHTKQKLIRNIIRVTLYIVHCGDIIYTMSYTAHVYITFQLSCHKVINIIIKCREFQVHVEWECILQQGHSLDGKELRLSENAYNMHQLLFKDAVPNNRFFRLQYYIIYGYKL